MSDIAIRVENLSKMYHIGRAQQRHDTLRDAVMDTWQRLRTRRADRETGDEILWALRDVSFEVRRGEAVGIIGRNGAGKSTLLKILSRITEPTVGRVLMEGRVASLLEVGTGFHPELTGRENIYLNGAILGMHKSEIERRFDEIVAFAEVERFLDTPVKRYSSGMYVRLAFAVAAHLEPEILLVDEVLAVGDAQFQKKCLGKMGDVAKEGRTVLFVSHNMSAVQRLCPWCLWFQDGHVAAQGESQRLVADYVSAGNSETGPNTWIDVSQAERRGTGQARFTAVQYAGLEGDWVREPRTCGVLQVRIALVAELAMILGSLALTLYDTNGCKLVNADSIALGRALPLHPGRNEFLLTVKHLYLNAGTYVLGLWMADTVGTAVDHIDSAFRIQIIAPEPRSLGVRPRSDGVVPCEFEVVQISETNPDAVA